MSACALSIVMQSMSIKIETHLLQIVHYVILYTSICYSPSII